MKSRINKLRDKIEQVTNGNVEGVEYLSRNILAPKLLESCTARPMEPHSYRIRMKFISKYPGLVDEPDFFRDLENTASYLESLGLIERVDPKTNIYRSTESGRRVLGAYQALLENSLIAGKKVVGDSVTPKKARKLITDLLNDC